MTLEETIDLLTVAAAYDRRTLGEGDAMAWHAAVGDLDFVDARKAVIGHYTDGTGWLMPAHVRQRVKAMRRDRLERSPAAAPPAELTGDPGRYRAALQAGIRRTAGGFSLRRALGGPIEGDPPADWKQARQALGQARDTSGPGAGATP
jgi:hypothetical protein